MIFSGTVLFTSTMLREMSLGHIPGPQGAVYWVLSLVLFFLWLLILAMGKPKLRWLSVVAAIIGALIFSCCSAITWSMVVPKTGG